MNERRGKGGLKRVKQDLAPKKNNEKKKQKTEILDIQEYIGEPFRRFVYLSGIYRPAFLNGYSPE